MVPEGTIFCLLGINMIELLMLAGDKKSTGSQVQWTVPGTYQWTVPKGITEVSVLLIGAGSHGSVLNRVSAGGYGGSVRWKNKIAVTPGQVIQIVVGNAGRRVSSTGDISSNHTSTTLRSTAFGLYAGCYQDASPIVVDMGGGYGGTGGLPANNGRRSAGGAVAKINSNGDSGDVSPGCGMNPATLATTYPTKLSDTVYTAAGEAGGGGQARTDLAVDGGDSVGSAAGNGAVRIIWGVGREYPDKGVIDVK